MSDQVNPQLEAVERLIKSALWDVVLEMELAAMFAAGGWVAAWPARPIITGLARLLSDKIFAKAKLLVDLRAVKLLNAEHQKEFDKAAVTLKVIAINRGVNSAQFEVAKSNAKDALARFVRVNA